MCFDLKCGSMHCEALVQSDHVVEVIIQWKNLKNVLSFFFLFYVIPNQEAKGLLAEQLSLSLELLELLADRACNF